MNICDQFRRQLNELFRCEEVGDRTRIRTPFLYPDGDVVDVFVEAQDDRGRVTDLGESMAWLRMQSTAPRRSPKQTALIHDVCLTLGVEFYQGQLRARYDGVADMVDAVERVGQAAVRVSDLWFTFRTRAFESINDEVSEFLESRNIDFERSVKIPGRSGRPWTIDFQTSTERRSSLVLVASTGDRSAAKKVSEHVIAAWHDLSHLRVGREPLHALTLVDDSADVWSEHDLNLMSSLSDLSRWSNPDEFIDHLNAA